MPSGIVRPRRNALVGIDGHWASGGLSLWVNRSEKLSHASAGSVKPSLDGGYGESQDERGFACGVSADVTVCEHRSIQFRQSRGGTGDPIAKEDRSERFVPGHVGRDGRDVAFESVGPGAMSKV